MRPADQLKLTNLAVRAREGFELLPREIRALKRAVAPVEGESVQELAARVLGDFHAHRGIFTRP